MPARFLGVGRGLNQRSGRGPRPGYLLKARNGRYLPGDTESRLWALLGRSLFNATALPANAKAIFPFYIDGGASYLCAHNGDSIYEANLGLTGSFSSALSMGGTGSSRGIPFSYLNKLFYPSGPSQDLGFWTRQASGWVKGGHRYPDFPDVNYNVTDEGVGTFGSTTNLFRTVRIYDNTTGTESAHGDVVDSGGISSPNLTHFLYTFNAPVNLHGARGTHLRIYRSLLSEPAGKLYRIDGQGDGIPLASIIPGFTFVDNITNEQALINGLVQSDGEEASLSWAEYGGPPPQARGGMVFNDHGCLWGVPGYESRVFYSAQGLMECYPVDFDRVYQYYLTFSTSKQDRVMLCRPAGPYMLVLNENSVFRVLSLPTYQDAGFNRKVQDTLTVDHGAASFWAADSFGIGTEESSWCIYVSREHGPMLTNGVSDRPIMSAANWHGIVEKSAVDQIVVRNYSTMQEAWIFFPAKGSSRCNQALIADYSAMAGAGVGASYSSAGSLGLRVTGPVDVQGDDAFLGWTADGERFYLVSAYSPYIYVQDNGNTDEQENTNSDGDIRLEWDVPATRLGGDVFRNANPPRVAIEGASGTAKTIDLTVVAADGVEEYSETDSVQLGPGETDDAGMAALAGNSHRLEIRYTGPTGSTYDPDDADCAPCLGGVTWEQGATGRQKRMSGV